jgi:hypothetical protein
MAAETLTPDDHVNNDGNLIEAPLEQIEPIAEKATLTERARALGRDTLKMLRVGAGIPKLPDNGPIEPWSRPLGKHRAETTLDKVVNLMKDGYGIKHG